MVGHTIKKEITDLEDKTIDRLDTDSEDDFDPESDEEDLRDMNMQD
jgi:hypothetical protein